MKTIVLLKAVVLTLDGGEVVKLPVGSQQVEDEVADHWFVKAHCEGVPVAAPAPNSHEAALAAAQDAEEKAKAAAEEAARLAAEEEAARLAAEEEVKQKTKKAIVEKANAAAAAAEK